MEDNKINIRNLQPHHYLFASIQNFGPIGKQKKNTWELWVRVHSPSCFRANNVKYLVWRRLSRAYCFHNYKLKLFLLRLRFWCFRQAEIKGPSSLLQYDHWNNAKYGAAQRKILVFKLLPIVKQRVNSLWTFNVPTHTMWYKK